MGMIANLIRVPESELAEILEDSTILENIVYADDDYGQENERVADIDKSWDGIIFLLTGHSIQNASHPLVNVLFSGQLIDEEQDMGYGPAHYLTSVQVKELNEQISGLTEEDLRKRFNPAEMKKQGVYPDIWDEGDDAFEYIYEGFISLQHTFITAAANNEAIITYVS